MMKNKMFSIVLLAVAAVLLAIAPAAQAAVILSDGHTGDYRIIFVTLADHGAKDTDIGTYNTWVDAQAKLPESTQTKDFTTTWNVVGSTKLTDATDNTGTEPGLGSQTHIYTPSATLGTYTLVAESYAALWNAANVDILNGIRYADGTLSDESNGGGDQIWTGTDSDGSTRVTTGGSGSYLGAGQNGDNTSPYIRLVRGGKTDGNWISGVSDHDGNDSGSVMEKNFMGMSGVMSTEPAGTVFIIH
jgi:hypothetical protein